MGKIGFIDYFLDEWHAENYPAWIKQASQGRWEVTYAWALTDIGDGKKSNKDWCKAKGIEQCRSIEELVEKSDALVVLSPDNPEYHESLSELALRSGKPVYIDKTFADTKEIALRIFENAYKYSTPCFSSSALRFAEEYRDVGNKLCNLVSWGPGKFRNYSVHQIEPVIHLMGTSVRRVMSIGNQNLESLLLEFNDARTATITHFPSAPFMMNWNYLDSSKIVTVQSDFFQEFIKKLVAFFDTKLTPVPHEETIAIMAVREAGSKALGEIGVWINL